MLFRSKRHSFNYGKILQKNLENDPDLLKEFTE